MNTNISSATGCVLGCHPDGSCRNHQDSAGLWPRPDAAANECGYKFRDRYCIPRRYIMLRQCFTCRMNVPCNKWSNAPVFYVLPERLRNLARMYWLRLKSIDRCVVTCIEKLTRLPSARTVVRLPVPIVVRIRDRESLVAGHARRNCSNPDGWKSTWDRVWESARNRRCLLQFRLTSFSD